MQNGTNKVEITFTITRNGEKESVKIKAMTEREAWRRLIEQQLMDDVEKVVLTTTRCL
ncbi:hypothetical protein [Enterobacter ludwigii]